MYETMTDAELTIAAIMAGIITWEGSGTFTLSGVYEYCITGQNYQPILSEDTRSRLVQHMELKAKELSVLD